MFTKTIDKIKALKLIHRCVYIDEFINIAKPWSRRRFVKSTKQMCRRQATNIVKSNNRKTDLRDSANLLQFGAKICVMNASINGFTLCLFICFPRFSFLSKQARNYLSRVQLTLLVPYMLYTLHFCQEGCSIAFLSRYFHTLMDFRFFVNHTLPTSR